MVLLEQVEVLLVDEARQGVGRGAHVEQAALLGLGGPLVGVAVAVEDDALVRGERGLDPLRGLDDRSRTRRRRPCRWQSASSCSATAVFSTMFGSERFCCEPQHAELELVARERERRGAVAVRAVLGEVGELRDAQVHLLARVARVGLVVDEGVHDGGKVVAQEDGDDCGRSLVGAQTVVVAGRGNACAQQVLVVVDRGDDAGEEDEELQVVLGRIATGRAGSCRSAEMDQLLCLPEPLTPSKGFSCCRQTRPWWEAIIFIFSIVTQVVVDGRWSWSRRWAQARAGTGRPRCAWSWPARRASTARRRAPS